jgi:hypothetical protein
MQAFLDDNPADKHGRHLYQLADTGLDLEKLREMFANYENHFDIPREEI